MPNPYSCKLYMNSSNEKVLNKNITLMGDFTCEFKSIIDVENPEIYVQAGEGYDKANYMYVAKTGRYYFCKGKLGPGQSITFECKSDPIMSFKSGILSSPVVVARNPWHFDLYLPDPKLPIEARTVSNVLKFPREHFKGTNNSYILTTLGSG